MRQAEPAGCALARLGEAQMLLAQAIAQSPAPRQLSAGQRKIYRAALDEKARPLYDEARDTLRAADGKAHELGVMGACVSQAVALLEKLGGMPAARARVGPLRFPLADTPELIDAAGRSAPSEEGTGMPSSPSGVDRTTAAPSTAQVASQPRLAPAGREK